MKEYNAEQKQELNKDTPKKVYRTPQLTTVGNVKELTLGGGSQFFDEGGVEPLF